MTVDADLLIDLVVEYWRLLRAAEASLTWVPDERRARCLPPIRYAEGRLAALLERSGIVLAVFDGRVYDPGLPATPVNGDECAGHAGSRVSRTLEPAVVREGRILRFGKIILEAEPDS